MKIRIPRPKVSIAIAIAAMAVMCIPLGWRSNSVSRQNRAIAGILGADYDAVFITPDGKEQTAIHYLSRETITELSITRHDADSARLSNEVQQLLHAFNDLQVVRIIGFDLSSGDVAALAGGGDVREFEWSIDSEQPVASPRGIVDTLVSKSPRLQSLLLSGVPVSDDDLQSLSHLRRLKELHVTHTHVDGTVLPKLASCPLEGLTIHSDRFTIDGFKSLRMFPGLRYCDLSGGNNLELDALEYAQDLSHVEELTFCVESGALSTAAEKALTSYDADTTFSGFIDMSRMPLPREGRMYQRFPLHNKAVP